jgi:hypothetical protein
LSPFNTQTKEIRDIDLAWFRHILADCETKIPRDLEPDLPGVLWLFQMGVIFFWVIDDSPNQARTERLLGVAARSVASLVKVSGLPFMRPLRKTALQLIQIVKGD